MVFHNWFTKINSKVKIKYLSILSCLLLLLTISCFIGLNSKNDVSAKEKITKIEKKKKEEKEEKVEKIKVDVKGAVVTPGVYELPLGSRVIDAINISGGLTEGANTSIINLSKVLKDGFVVVIYTDNDLKDVVMDKYVENNYSCPATINDACIVDSQNISITPSNTKSSTVTSNQESKSKDQNFNTIININTASVEELQTIQGIGESKAKAIIKYREENGGFKSIDELTNVSGIGESTLEKIKDNITF